MFCASCGAKAERHDAFCTRCGAPLHGLGAQPAPPPGWPQAPGPLPAKNQSSNTALFVALAVIGALMVLGIVAALAVPNLLTAREKARMKSTKQNINDLAIALYAYLADNGTLPVQQGPMDVGGELVKALSPFYIQNLQIKDSWGNDVLVFCGEACNGQYGFRDCHPDDFLIISRGKDGTQEDWTYDPGNENAGLFGNPRYKDFDRDLVMINGTWVRAPY